MAKKAAPAHFNMTTVIREILTANPNASAKEANDAILEKYPTAKINKNSFSVAFYTGRKKLGMNPASNRGRKVGMRKSLLNMATSAGGHHVDLAMLHATAKFLSEVGGADAAIEAIKHVQAIQVK